MSAPSFAVHSASPQQGLVEPLHSGAEAQQPQSTTEQGHGKMGLGAKGFLMKKMAAGGQSFCSPTDTMVSPCTKKLVQAKGRHYNKGKPLSLSSQFQASQGPQQSKMQQSSTLGMGGQENDAPEGLQV